MPFQRRGDFLISAAHRLPLHLRRLHPLHPLRLAITGRTRASTTRETPRAERTANDSVSARTPRLVLPLRRRTSVEEFRRVNGRMTSVLLIKRENLVLVYWGRQFWLPLL